MSSESHVIQLQPRDLRLLQGLLERPFMPLSYISFMYFGDHRDGAKKRVQRLTAAGYLRQQRRPPFKPSIYFLTRKAFSALQSHGMMDGYANISWVRLQRHMRLSTSIIDHEVGIMDVEMALTSATEKATHLSLKAFNTRSEEFQFFSYREKGYGAPKVLMIPDAFIRVAETAGGRTIDHAFFLELDRSTETLDTPVGKAMCYANYYKNGGYVQWLKEPANRMRKFPFRVLFVFATADRRNHFARRLSERKSHLRGQAWLTTKDEITKDPTGAIWIQPKDCATVSSGMSDATGKADRGGERNLVKRSLFLN